MTTSAIVIGSGIAGLISARVLSEHFDEVHLIDKDSLGDAEQSRKGVPQGQHIHLLWAGGMDILESYFPGLGAGLEANGSTVFDTSAQMRWYHHGVWKLRHHSNLKVYSQTRPHLERGIYQRVVALNSVNILHRHGFHSLRLNDDHNRVTGVEIENLDTGKHLSLDADLVVDASGRGSVTLQDLKARGFSVPEEESIEVDIGYATRLFEQPENHGADWQAMAIYPKAPHSHRLGVIFPIENRQWIVTLVGLRGHYQRNTDEAEYLEFASKLEETDIYDAIKDAVPVSPIRLIRYANQNRRHFDRLTDYPAGLIPIGDAMCSLNPLYGQGMTVSIKQAAALDECLLQVDLNNAASSFQANYFRKVKPFIDDAWLLGGASDFLYPETVGKRPLFYGAIRWYITRMLELSETSPLVQESFLQVIHLKKRVWSLGHPRLLLTVLLKSV